VYVEVDVERVNMKDKALCHLQRTVQDGMITSSAVDAGEHVLDHHYLHSTIKK
jgi:hypothetical protein